MKININDSPAIWQQSLLQHFKDTVLLFEDSDDAVWFTSNLMQQLIRTGGSEVIPIYGKQIENLNQFIYQVNCSLPVGYEIASHLDALYDLVLNFETEPPERIFIWTNAEHLFKYDRNCFEQIAEQLLSAAYLNRNGQSTRKEDGSRYRVDQINLFIFNRTNLEEISDFLEKEYVMMSIDHAPAGIKAKIDWNIVQVTSAK